MAPQNISFSFLVPVNVTLFGKKLFADMIKYLEIEKYPGEINIKYSYTKEAEGDLAHRRGGGMKTAERDWKYWP